MVPGVRELRDHAPALGSLLVSHDHLNHIYI
jgi:phosphoribosyl 1,2-cyclic phosphodiesterase